MVNLSLFARSTFSQKKLSIISFSLFFAWLLAFPFEGQVLYSLAENTQASGAFLSLTVVFAHFLGLFINGFLVKNQDAAKLTMVTSTVVCVAGSLIFFLPFSSLWYISLCGIAFFAGLYVSSWGFYLKSYSKTESRLKTVADVLIYSNIIMILINVITVYTTAFLGLALTIITLLASLIMTIRLEASSNSSALSSTDYPISRALIFLCLFILIITINSGFMYQVFNPAFAHFQLLTSYYWAIPYIAALIVLRKIADKINIAYIFYIAIVMIGVAYILFMSLDRSVTSYLLIDTFMLGAFGVSDLFWWSILGSFLDYSNNPAKIMGIGLSMNVLGILVGGYFGSIILSMDNPYFITSAIALVIVLSVLIMFPLLNNQLIQLLNHHVFLVKFSKMNKQEQDETLSRIKKEGQLTEKEMEIVNLLLRGYTYKAASKNLFISENTVKFHIKNIYSKLEINSKMELIKTFADKEE